MVIGIEGKPAVGKSSVAKHLKQQLSAIHIEESDLLLEVVDLAIYLQNNNITNKDIVSIINNLYITYKLDNLHIIFNLNYNYIPSNLTPLEKKVFAYQNKELKDLLIKKIYSDLQSIIDNLKKEYIIILTGHELYLVYPDMDICFTLVSNDKKRIDREVKRDSNLSLVNIREEEDKIFFNNTIDSIVIDTNNKSIEDISVEIIANLPKYD